MAREEAGESEEMEIDGKRETEKPKEEKVRELGLDFRARPFAVGQLKD